MGRRGHAMTRDSSVTARTSLTRGVALIVLAAVVLGCQSEPDRVETSIAAYRDRMLARNQEEPPPGITPPRDPVAQPARPDLPPRSALPAGPHTTTQPAPADLLAEVPDPAEAAAVLADRLERLRKEQEGRPDQRIVRTYERVVQQANELLTMNGGRPQRTLGLAECVERTLANNYTIRIEAYNPAIAQTQIVEAEAAFDVEFFLDTTLQDLDQPPGSTFVAGQADVRKYQGGFRQLLPTGMQTSVGLAQSRTWNNLPAEFQSVNPLHESTFFAEFRQPLLRGFGLDVNRAQIMIARLGHEASYEVFVQRVSDTILQVETAYWQLAQARRRAVVLAETVAQTYVTYLNMKERLLNDATAVEVANSEARYRSQYVVFLESLKLIRDAEDRLKNLMNDPELKLSEQLEIIPTETPYVAPTVLDHFAEVRTALEERSEIRAQRKRIDQRRVATNVAKNQILPQLDVSFRYDVAGSGNSADNSFDNLTTNRYISCTLAVNFAYNFGERAARARHQRARLEEAQSVVELNQLADAVVEEVNERIRTLIVRYEQIPPQYDSVVAAERNLRAYQARTQRVDPLYLQNELQAVEQLGQNRTQLLNVLTDYNVGIIQLERAKGTLLEYNNITVTDVRSPR